MFKVLLGLLLAVGTPVEIVTLIIFTIQCIGSIFEEPDSNKEANPSLKADQIVSDPSTGQTKTAGANPLPEAKAGKNSHYPDSIQLVDVLDEEIRLAIETEILEVLRAR
ncbi:hypothetical protein MAP00_000674 [Monascus purpureus]|nr:hypothetical protein MAP00_000674 [Monascus purpureus]